MNKAYAVAITIVLLIVMPIWFYLLYQILVRVNASELMFFLFWVYVPTELIATIIVRICTSQEKEQ